MLKEACVAVLVIIKEFWNLLVLYVVKALHFYGFLDWNRLRTCALECLDLFVSPDRR
jgi:hypothetical protein